MAGQNVLLIVSDEHSREVLGCYGVDYMYTLNIDCLAASLLVEYVSTDMLP